MEKQIEIQLELSPSAILRLKTAMEIAKANGGEVVICNNHQTRTRGEWMQNGKTSAAECKAFAQANGVAFEVRQNGDVWKYAREANPRKVKNPVWLWL